MRAPILFFARAPNNFCARTHLIFSCVHTHHIFVHAHVSFFMRRFTHVSNMSEQFPYKYSKLHHAFKILSAIKSRILSQKDTHSYIWAQKIIDVGPKTFMYVCTSKETYDGCAKNMMSERAHEYNRCACINRMSARASLEWVRVHQ